MLTRNDIETIVDLLDSSEYIRKSRITGDWYQIYCPFHNNGQERKPSCGVLLQEQYKNGQRYSAGMFHCFSCGASKPLEVGLSEILKNHASTLSASDWLTRNIPGYAPDPNEVERMLPGSIVKDVTDAFAAKNLRLRLHAQKEYVSEEELASYRFTVPYMYERKLTDPVIIKYDVGFDANHVPSGRSKPLPCITFPVRDEQGHTLFFCRRSIEGKYFNYPQGVTKPVYGLYELPKDCRSVIVCESVFNALTAVVYGYNAVALLGTGNSYQITQLKRLGVREYVICLDGDEAGMKGTQKLKNALSQSGIVWTIHMPPDKDVNDCTKEEFDQLYQQKD